ncbi:glutathione synthase [Methylotenera sp.]|uniref:glutathione synthase n=1 Tax=Methylotenera sp. TaxID=2051956 RepID=UPI00272834A0|nr:glutathione synthase [Methylotenera sp.]MDO9394227.1 glutathione synthase [Methylotenera sp.]MDP1523411.1 glutathione synthase [Methylotenera sp.]MDP2070549.1 glutathione synthase [Methylotenera sp.]MDP3006149.1 glutathione synthase [Methylotenera sp.]MDP3307952.1 glutathione synthase [Methylotenera sp.]
MKLLFILDPLESLKAYKDTSLAIMREAANRGHELFVSQQHDLFLRGDIAKINAKKFTFTEQLFSTEGAIEYVPADFNAVIMRKDPPFDNEYLYSTYLLEIAANQGAKVYNNPSAIRGWNEKLSVTRFPQFTPEFLVTANNDLIREFLKQHQDIVVKPLDGMGGSSIFRLGLKDPNISVILETITNFGTRTIMAQRYLPAILQGDKRIIVIDGTPLPYSLARIPMAGETRGNLAAGGTGVAQLLSERDLEIATTVGKVLKQAGLFLVGLDVIGDYLTEINVTSPTGMVEIAKQTQHLTQPCNPASVMMDAMERHAVL